MKINRASLLAGSILCGAVLPAPALAQTTAAQTSAASAQGTSAAAAKPVQPYYRNIRPFYRNIRPFWGDVNPFYRNIRAFWGDVDPFYRNIRAFWGAVDPIVSAQVVGAPAYDKVGPFWEDLGNDWSALSANWETAGTYASNPTKYAAIATQLKGIVTKSETMWGKAVTAETGTSFSKGFAEKLFTRFGIDPNNPASLAALTPAEQSHFFIDWYDGLMGYSGTDHADHWMKTVDWTPSLTQVQGDGKDAVIGLLDFVVAGDQDIRNNVVAYDGVSNFTNGHGAGVASLMVAAHDGKGVMGIAPEASVVAFNPFDESGTAGWEDITRGVAMLSGKAGVVNMSLGTPGWTLEADWSKVFSSPGVAANLKSTVFIKAAGNDGITQTQNIKWDWANNPALLVVGSVDPTGKISEFSNRPGEACLLTGTGACSEQNKLKYRFVVAPGELILVSDDQGGVTRQTGTSFSAPIVAGTVALLLDRWPWLAGNPQATVDIITSTAKDLGAPGVDGVYGAGLIDVEAAQSPKSFDQLVWYQWDGKKPTEKSVDSVQKTVTQADTSKWDSKDMFFYTFERLAGGSQRDFAIPLSSKLVDQTLYVNGANEQFQAYLYDRMVDWVNTSGTPTKGKFTNFITSAAPVQNRMGLNLSMSFAPRSAAFGFSRRGVAYQSSVRLATPSDKFGVRVGYGDGAVLLGGRESFGLFSSYDSRTGGVNPVLGIASGGAYAGADVALDGKTTLTIGGTEKTLTRDWRNASVLENSLYRDVNRYKASGVNIGVTHRVNEAMVVSASYTRVGERSALLGVQSLDRNDLGHGSTTEGATFGLDYELGHGLSVATSATVGRTQTSNGSRQNLAVSDGGLLSTASEVAFAKAGIFGRMDRARLSVSQAMHVESGSLDYTVIKVVDRNTGEIGPVTEKIGVSAGKRPLFTEFLYGAPILKGAGEMSAFGRFQLQGTSQDSLNSGMVVGGRFRMGF
ncbi:S8 family peptidase [Allosphingosinicella deserti]|nr:S8 family serine peptidase [Sphingomonas deserti]